MSTAMKKTELFLTGGPGHPVSPLIFGNFLEHIETCIGGGVYDLGNPLSDEKGIRQDVLEKCKELGPTILRFPGGTVMGIYHWEDHVGPLGSRKKMRNIVWGGMLCHGFGTAEFVEYCRAVGAEPMICVNMPTGTPEEAANWVEYCNGTGDTYYANLRRSHGYEEPFGVKYWCIGNESYAEPDLGTQHDIKVYLRDAWEFTKYMKMTDDSIKMVYVGNDEAWNRAVLESLGNVCDYLSIHFYANTNAGEYAPFAMTEEFLRDTLEPAFRLLDEYNEREVNLATWYRISPRQDKIRIALDEWNIWNAGKTELSRYGVIQSYNWINAVWTAEFLNLLIRNSDRIGIANMAQMVNVIAPIMAEKEGSYRQTTFYPIKLFREHVGEAFLPSRCEGLDVAVTQRGEKRVVFAVNRGDEAVELSLPFEAGRLITAACPDIGCVNTLEKDYVTISENASKGAEQVIPACCVCVILEK